LKIILAAMLIGAAVWMVLAFMDKRSTDSTQPAYLIDYSVYHLSIQERAVSLLAAAFVLFILGYIFYMNEIAAGLFACFAFLYPRIRSKELQQKRVKDLSIQFNQALYSLSSSLAAGRSVDNAFREAAKDLKLLYPDAETYIIKEFDIINRRVENGEPIEAALLDFSRRADADDIDNFADVFVTCKRTGGNLVEVIRRTSNIIAEKLDIQQEIHVMVAQKRFEAKALGVIPFGIVAFLSFGSPDYMSHLYNGVGYVIMTVSLILLLLVQWITKWIMDIKV
jgi:tight adherence protein B